MSVEYFQIFVKAYQMIMNRDIKNYECGYNGSVSARTVMLPVIRNLLS